MGDSKPTTKTVFNHAVHAGGLMAKYGIPTAFSALAVTDIVRDVRQGHYLEAVLDNAYAFPDIAFIGGSIASASGIAGGARVAAAGATGASLAWTAGIAFFADIAKSGAYHFGFVDQPGMMEQWGTRQANLDAAHKALFPKDTPRPTQLQIHRDADSAWTEITPGQYSVHTTTFAERGLSLHSEQILDRRQSNALTNETRWFPAFAGKYPGKADEGFNAIAKTLAEAPLEQRGDIWRAYLTDSVAQNAVQIMRERNPKAEITDGTMVIPDEVMNSAGQQVLGAVRETYIYGQLNFLDPRFVNDRNLNTSFDEFIRIEKALEARGTPMAWDNKEHIALMKEALDQRLGPEPAAPQLHSSRLVASASP